MSKAAMNLQDSFLNQVRRENSEVRVLLVNGTLLRGTVKGFDNFTLILNNRNGQHLIYKHAVAQIVTHRPHLKNDDLHPSDEINASENETSENESVKESPEVLSADVEVPQQETKQKPSPRQGAPGSDRPARTNDRPARTNAPHGDRTPRQNTPQGDRPPRSNAPQGNRPQRPNVPEPQGADQNSRPKPKKEGFNTLDLSSVKLGDTK